MVNLWPLTSDLINLLDILNLTLLLLLSTNPLSRMGIYQTNLQQTKNSYYFAADENSKKVCSKWPFLTIDSTSTYTWTSYDDLSFRRRRRRRDTSNATYSIPLWGQQNIDASSCNEGMAYLHYHLINLHEIASSHHRW